MGVLGEKRLFLILLIPEMPKMSGFLTRVGPGVEGEGIPFNRTTREHSHEFM
jgi:hypothetical protein